MGGRYRDALVAQLSQLYSGSQRQREYPQELDELSGENWTELDRMYGEYVYELARKLASPTEVSAP